MNLHAAERVEGATPVVAIVPSAMDGNAQTSTQGKVGREGIIKTHHASVH